LFGSNTILVRFERVRAVQRLRPKARAVGAARLHADVRLVPADFQRNGRPRLPRQHFPRRADELIVDVVVERRVFLDIAGVFQENRVVGPYGQHAALEIETLEPEPVRRAQAPLRNRGADVFVPVRAGEDLRPRRIDLVRAMVVVVSESPYEDALRQHSVPDAHLYGFPQYASAHRNQRYAAVKDLDARQPFQRRDIRGRQEHAAFRQQPRGDAGMARDAEPARRAARVHGLLRRPAYESVRPDQQDPVLFDVLLPFIRGNARLRGRAARVVEIFLPAVHDDVVPGGFVFFQDRRERAGIFRGNVVHVKIALIPPGTRPGQAPVGVDICLHGNGLLLRRKINI